MKSLNIILAVAVALAVSSCAQFDKYKTGSKNKPNLFDPKAESGPTTGHSYYNSGSTTAERKTTSPSSSTVKSKPVSTKGTSTKLDSKLNTKKKTTTKKTL